ncbi:MAG: DNA cytosine methyltransferase [Verrucomicrobia bacterium]|nr:DNA cytosine methyltransferase [Verrucomicrobiota bacterium]
MKLNVLELYAGTGRSLQPFLTWPNTGKAFLVDNSEYAATVYRHNFPHAAYAVLDLNRVSTSKLAEFVGGPVDILLGCPPCQGFSDCGLKNSSDPRNKHVSRFHAVVSDLRPKFLAMENVPLIVTSRRFRKFVRGLEELGYIWTAAIVNAVLWGSCQSRQRLVLVAAQDKLSVQPSFPEPTHGGKLEHDPLIGRDFDFIANLTRHKLVVLDCRHLSLRQTQLIAAAAARELQAYGRMMTRRANEREDPDAESWFSVLFIDEAHAVAPNDEGVVSTQVIYELARMGRHVRTGLIMSSQSPSDLDGSVLKRLQSRFVFALERDQLKSISGINADLNPKILEQLPKLPKGVCAVSGSSELINHGFLLEVRNRRTPVGGTTPKVFHNRKKRS